MILSRFAPKSTRQAIFNLIIAIFFFSLSGVLIKLSNWEALPLNSGRSIVACLFLLLVAGKPKFTWSPTQIGGAVAYVGTLLTFVIATQLTTAANAVFLQFTAPVYVAVLGIWLLREMPRRSDIFFMAIALLGMGLFFGDELTPAGMTGNLVAILSGICLAFLITLLSKEKNGSPLATVVLGNFLSALVGIPALLGQSWDWGEVALILLLGVVQLGFPFLLYTQAIKHLRALEVMLIQSLEPILNPIWVFIVVAELPAPLATIGSLVVLIAVMGRAYVTIRENQEAIA